MPRVGFGGVCCVVPTHARRRGKLLNRRFTRRCPGMAEIALSGNAAATVDDADVPLVSSYVWSVERRGGKAYAVCYLDAADLTRKVLMHRIIMGAKRGELVDHVNGDSLDNRRTNLRLCTVAQNGMNRRKQRTRAATASRFKGVSWDRSNGIWRARIVLKGKQHSLGNFRVEDDAARAYDAAAKEHFGAFACTNEDMGLYEGAQPQPAIEMSGHVAVC